MKSELGNQLRRDRNIYRCYKKYLRASHGFAELCFSYNEWITSEKEWEDYHQTHLDKSEGVPTQCNPFIYGGCLASPGYCTWCLGDLALPAAI
jgi:hypothetical protein